MTVVNDKGTFSVQFCYTAKNIASILKLQNGTVPNQQSFQCWLDPRLNAVSAQMCLQITKDDLHETLNWKC